MKNWTTFLILINCAFNLIAQDTTIVTFQDYQQLNQWDGFYQITDIFNKPYKLVFQKDEQVIQRLLLDSATIKIDTTFYSNGESEPRIPNERLLFEYYSKYIQSPKHSGDPNDATVSFLIDADGNVKHISVLKNVKNACDNNWKIHYNNDISFQPFVFKGMAYMTEYIIKVDDLCYCICDTIEKKENKKKH